MEDETNVKSVSTQTDFSDDEEDISATITGALKRTVATQIDMPLSLREFIKQPRSQQILREYRLSLEKEKLRSQKVPLEVITPSTLKEWLKRTENVHSQEPAAPTEVMDPSTSRERTEKVQSQKPATPTEVMAPSTPRHINHEDLICRTESEDEPEPPKSWLEKVLPKSVVRLLRPKRKRKRRRRSCFDQLDRPSTSHHQCKIHLPTRSSFFIPYTYSSDETESDKDTPKRKKPRKF